MEDIRPYGDSDETLRQWPPRETDERSREYEAVRDDEVPFHVPRD